MSCVLQDLRQVKIYTIREQLVPLDGLANISLSGALAVAVSTLSNDTDSQLVCAC